ncbi:unnamed protein product [Amoebophrya sp. A120]|nr:unnamed protein product [Amoebophrya sp. A120]|eukprot:GSA120T00017690001.1
MITSIIFLRRWMTCFATVEADFLSRKSSFHFHYTVHLRMQENQSTGFGTTSIPSLASVPVFMGNIFRITTNRR